MGEVSCSQSLLIELATYMLKIKSLEENCVGDSWINRGALQDTVHWFHSWRIKSSQTGLCVGKYHNW